MTARDEAITALLDGLRQVHIGMTKSSAETVLDAIPPGVLARLAIEQGGLIEVISDDDGAIWDHDTGDAVVAAIYRVVEP